MLFVGLNLSAGMPNTWRQRCSSINREKMPSVFSAHSYGSFIWLEQTAFSFKCRGVNYLPGLRSSYVMEDTALDENLCRLESSVYTVRYMSVYKLVPFEM